jgi:hypothetical protein
MAASCGTCMAWRIVPPRASVAVHTPCVWAHDLSCEAEACRARGGSSCEVETSRARQRLVVGVPLVGNWSVMQPTGRRLHVFPVWVLTRVLSTPCPEVGCVWQEKLGAELVFRIWSCAKHTLSAVQGRPYHLMVATCSTKCKVR